MNRTTTLAAVCYAAIMGGFALWLAWQFIALIPTDSTLFVSLTFGFIFTLIWCLIVGVAASITGTAVAALSMLVGYAVGHFYPRA